MKITLAKRHGFCFGVKRAIKLAESNENGITTGPLIHNQLETERLRSKYGITINERLEQIPEGSRVIIRTHGIPKHDFKTLEARQQIIIDATCPFVTKPQKICESMSEEGYQIVIFGDIEHPEVKSVMSYALTPPIVAATMDELPSAKLKERVALVSQTTKKIEDFFKIAEYLIMRCAEVRVFNTICNATFDNQESAKHLSQNSDIMIVVGGRNSSNTKQLFSICQEQCAASYLIEAANELQPEWFFDKEACGITAGASTPQWIIDAVMERIQNYLSSKEV